MYFIRRQPSLVAKSHICRRRGRKKTLPIQGNYHQNIQFLKRYDFSYFWKFYSLCFSKWYLYKLNNKLRQDSNR